MAVIIWHNPQCTKSRKTLALLQDGGHDPFVRLYLQDPPDVTEISAARDQLKVHAIAMIRTNESIFTDLGLADADDEGLIAAMAAHPILIERPIVFVNGRAAIGRPPENVAAIL